MLQPADNGDNGLGVDAPQHRSRRRRRRKLTIVNVYQPKRPVFPAATACSVQSLKPAMSMLSLSTSLSLSFSFFFSFFLGLTAAEPLQTSGVTQPRFMNSQYPIKERSKPATYDLSVETIDLRPEMSASLIQDYEREKTTLPSKDKEINDESQPAVWIPYLGIIIIFAVFLVLIITFW